MATDAGGSRPLTALVAGNGQSSVSYTLPAGLLQYVQSVVATIDTTSSGDVTPLLTVTDDANIVVADKPQGRAIDAGGPGRATWALRLTDEAAPVVQSPYVQFVMDVSSGATIKGETNAVLAVLPDASVGGWSVGMHLDVIAAANDQIQLGANLYSTGLRLFMLTRTTVINVGAGTVEHLRGSAVAVTGPNSGLVTWDTHESGAVLLDLSTPNRPKFLAGGTYSLNVNVAVS